MSLTLDSRAFTAYSDVPPRYTCDGADVSPPLMWHELPPGTQSLALIVDDPDAPDPEHPKMTWVHWVVYNIPATMLGLAENAAARPPPGVQQGTNDWKRIGYGGPCPPVGKHRYYHKLYALDTMLPERDGLTKAEVEAAMQGHVLAMAELVGTYRRGG